MDIQVFLISLIILYNSDNKKLHKKYIENYCKQFEKYFLKDIYDVNIRNEVLDFILKTVPDSMIFTPQYVTMPFTYYLMAMSNDMVGSEFKLVNQLMQNGRVIIYYNKFVLMLRIKLEGIIFNRLKQKYETNEIINGYVEELKQKHPVKTYDQAPTISNNNNNTGILPPCISYMINKAKTQHDLEHKERLILGIYMVKKGYAEEEILDVYSQLSDYKESITKKGLKPLSRYMMYSCDKVESEGCCRKEQDKLGRCAKIINPFLY
jgi:DNA primase large subunit